MFKFATNKFNHHHNSSTNGANSATGSVQNSHMNKLEENSSRRRFQIQKELFAFNKIADKGFPSKPSAMDYDKKLRLLAIGSRNGDIRIYGEPNTPQQQLSCYQDIHPFPIQKMLFVQGQHQLITLSERVYRNDTTNKGESHLFLILWSIPNFTETTSSNLVEKIKEYQLDQKIVNNTRLSALSLLNDNSHLFIGFETGDVYVFNVQSFQLVPGVINKDYILKNIPNEINTRKLSQLGAVESIQHHPKQLTKLLIAYQRGLWIIFDFIKNQIDQINLTQQQIESAVFYQQGECVATSHSDGSFILWDLTSIDNTQVPTQCTSSSPPNIVYGPYPCKSVNKCFVKTCKNDQPYVIFSGGCPRVNYSDKITISVIQGENSHVCFDFTSKIIDFFTIDKPMMDNVNKQSVYDNPQALLVLLEEEFICIDLVSENWPLFKLPYLYSVHSSAIICTHYVNGCSKQFYECLKRYAALNQEQGELYSDREWPITSSINQNSSIDEINTNTNKISSERKDLLLTGHEDGSIRFWDVTNTSMTLLYRLKTSDYFQTDSTPCEDNLVEQNTDDNWPPFRKVGTFDPYSDDPKLGIQKIFLCPNKELLVVAGTAGQVLLLSLNDKELLLDYGKLQVHKINIIDVSPEVQSHFVWKGHEPLATRGTINNQPIQGCFRVAAGFQLKSMIQIYPPATVSALALNTDWQLIAMGTSHGFALFDYNHNKDLLIRCTLDPAMLLNTNPNESGSNGTTISRRKSLKKSLRESFRKLRRGRSQKHNTVKKLVSNEKTDDQELEHHKPIERQVESREFKPVDDIPPSVIRYMYFVRTFITSNQQQTNSLWVGTNTGIIYIYALQFLLNPSNMSSPKSPISSTRNNQSVNCLLAKEMRLKHRAPVVHIQVIDQYMNPLPFDHVTQQEQEHLNQNHKVIICSEEQFKVFQLPNLKPVCKFKLTAVEGARVRRIGYNCYISKTDPKYSEYCLSCLSNLGDLSVYSLPQLKRQVQIQCMKQQDINAITSFVFTKQGQAFYLQSPSEFVHISMSARDNPVLVRQDKKPIESNNESKTNASPAKPIPKPAPRTTLQKTEEKIETNPDNTACLTNTKQEINEAAPQLLHMQQQQQESFISINSPTKQDKEENKKLINSSQLTGQSDSFSANNTSGYTGSSNCTTINNTTINMSMDSVVEKFNNEDTSTKKLPSVIDENSSTQNDSLLNESEVSSDLNKLSLSKKSVNKTDNLVSEENSTNTNILKQNGSLSTGTSVTEATTDEDDGIEIPPQKSSSPMIKSNGPNLENGIRSNKIEQVTKRLENGNKLEYRETAID